MTITDLKKPAWDDYFMAKAFIASQRSIDDSTKHGCILVNKDKRVIGEGYNGPPQGALDYLIPMERPAKYIYMAHAEANALDSCHEDIEIAYITGRPCHKCLLRLIQRKVKRIIYGPVKSKCVDKSDIENSKSLLDVMRPEYRPSLEEYYGFKFLDVLKQTIEYSERFLKDSNE